MQSYRLYCLDGAGKFCLAEWLEATNDGEAVAKVRAMERGALKCEVWQGTRLVAKLDSQDLARLKGWVNPNWVMPSELHMGRTLSLR